MSFWQKWAADFQKVYNLYMSHESHENIPPVRAEVVAGLCALYEREKESTEDLTETRKTSREIEALHRYSEFHENAIDGRTEEDPIERQFQRLQFSFNLAQMYAEAGFMSEARSQIEEAMQAASTLQDQNPAFGDLYWEMSDYINPPTDEVSEE